MELKSCRFNRFEIMFVLCWFLFVLCYGLFAIYSKPRHISFVDQNVFVLTDPADTKYGTGFNVYYNDHIYTITNNHICGTETELSRKDSVYGETREVIKVLKRHPTKDLCLLTSSSKTGLTVSDETKTYKEYSYFGFPNGNKTYDTGISQNLIDIKVFLFEITTNELYLKCQNEGGIALMDINQMVCLKTEQLREITAVGYQGASGSPVFDKNFRVHGVVSNVDMITNHLYFIDSKYVIELIKLYENEKE